MTQGYVDMIPKYPFPHARSRKKMRISHTA